MNIATSSDDTQNAHPVVYLKDYQPPVYAVHQVDLDISIFDHETLVSSRLSMQRQHAGELVLLGRDLELLEIRVEGQVLRPEQYRLTNEQLTVLDAPNTCVVELVCGFIPKATPSLKACIKRAICLSPKTSRKAFVKLPFSPIVLMS